jgi:hypothetical protein
MAFFKSWKIVMARIKKSLQNLGLGFGKAGARLVSRVVGWVRVATSAALCRGIWIFPAKVQNLVNLLQIKRLVLMPRLQNL